MSWPRRLSSWFLILTAALITFHTLLCCGLREGALLIIAACLIPLCLLIGPTNSLILSFSLLTITLVLNLGINLTGVKKAIEFTAHTALQVFAHDRGMLTYKPNSRFQTMLPFGNLKRLNPKANLEVEPREEEFITGYARLVGYFTDK